jgi:aldose 1-epimerase
MGGDGRRGEVSRRGLIAGAAAGVGALALPVGTAGAGDAGAGSRARGVESPTGTQFTISGFGQRAVVTEVGASLRSYRVRGREVLAAFGADDVPEGYPGATLMPWPNRIDRGRYRFRGETYQTPVNERARDTALHGLVHAVNWRLRRRSPREVVLGYVLHASAVNGYPWTLDLEVGYAVTADRGLVCRTRARNVGRGIAPFGAGYHPYFQLGTPRIDANLLRVPAETRFTTNRRLIPTGRAPVAGTRYDFRAPRRIGGTELDTAFVDLVRDADGLARATLATADGSRVVTLAMDAAYRVIQVYTSDDPPTGTRRRGAIAIEPNTAGPDAFNTGDELIELSPGETFRATWSVSATG